MPRSGRRRVRADEARGAARTLRRPAGAVQAASGSAQAPARFVVVRDLSATCARLSATPSLGDSVRAQVGDRFSLDVTGAWSVIAIAGPEAQTVLRRLTHLHHFPSGGEIAHVQGHVLEREGGYWVLCPQEYGHYVWEVAVDRAAALGGGPVGVDALPGGAT